MLNYREHRQTVNRLSMLLGLPSGSQTVDVERNYFKNAPRTTYSQENRVVTKVSRSKQLSDTEAKSLRVSELSADLEASLAWDEELVFEPSEEIYVPAGTYQEPNIFSQPEEELRTRFGVNHFVRCEPTKGKALGWGVSPRWTGHVLNPDRGYEIFGNREEAEAYACGMMERQAHFLRLELGAV